MGVKLIYLINEILRWKVLYKPYFSVTFSQILKKVCQKSQKVIFPHMINMRIFRSPRHLLKSKFRKRKKYVFTFFEFGTRIIP